MDAILTPQNCTFAASRGMNRSLFWFPGDIFKEFTTKQVYFCFWWYIQKKFFFVHFPACSPSNTNIVIDARVPGEISTPVFPDGSSGSSCTWKIQAPENFRLEITIKVLKLTGADDYLIIRDGAETTSPLFGKYGPCASGSLTLFCSGNSAFLQMVSAVFTVNDKLRIAYKPAEPGKSNVGVYSYSLMLVVLTPHTWTCL